MKKISLLLIISIFALLASFLPAALADERVIIGSDVKNDEKKAAENVSPAKTSDAPDEEPVVIGKEKPDVKSDTGAVNEKAEQKKEQEAPKTPAGLAASFSENRVKLVWNAVEGVKNYAVYRDDKAEITKNASVSYAALNEYEDGDIKSGKTYYYFVASALKSADGSKKYIESKPSDPVKIETVQAKSAVSPTASATPADNAISVAANAAPVNNVIAPAAPEAPQNIVAAAQKKSVKLLWENSKNANADGYFIYRSAERAGSYEKLNVSKPIAENHFEDSNIQAGKEYFYKISMVDKNKKESATSEPVAVKIKIQANIDFGKFGNDLYYAFSYNPETGSLYYAESIDAKSWKWWTLLQGSFPLPPDFSNKCSLSFAKDGKKIVAYIYDTQKMSISTAVSTDEGKNWNWWSNFSASFPLPDGFNSDTKINFSIKDSTVYCICLNMQSKTLSAASTSDGKSWKWWKQYGRGLSALPNESAASQYSASFFNNGFEVFSFNLEDTTLYKGSLSTDSTNYSVWNEVSNKFPKPPNFE